MPSNFAQLRLHALGFKLNGTSESKKAFDNLWNKHHPTTLADALKLTKTQRRHHIEELWELVWRFRIKK